MIGLRTLRHTLPSQYRDTAYCFEQAEGCVCLTIDDGLCRNGEQASLVRREKKRNRACVITLTLDWRARAGGGGAAAAEGAQRARDVLRLLQVLGGYGGAKTLWIHYFGWYGGPQATMNTLLRTPECCRCIVLHDMQVPQYSNLQRLPNMEDATFGLHAHSKL